jgi:GWxTD domain-containing protein
MVMHSSQVTRRFSRTRALALVVLFLTAASCASGNRGGSRTAPAPRRGAPASTGTGAALYERAGLIAVAGPVSYVGTLGYFAAPSPDTTLSLLTLSLTARTLTFTREGDRFRAGYSVTADIRQGASIAHHFDAKETVRVRSFKETTRGEESIIFQEYFGLAPGSYTLSLAVRDEAGAKAGTYEGQIIIPAISARGLSSSVPVHEATPRSSVDALPRLVAAPRSTAVFGRDSILAAYVEAYELAPGEPLLATVRGEKGAVLWSEPVDLSRTGRVASGVVQVPVSKLGIGAIELILSRADVADTARTPLFVSFGDELPIASFEDMLSYLRFYASPTRIKALREAASDMRSEAWSVFLAETDPVPTTPQHEGLQLYFSRIQRANLEFREEGSQGWLSDRGMVFVSLGEPDQILEPNGMQLNQRGQAQIWDYQRLQLQLIFIDQTGFGRWRLTQNSELEFQAAVRREQGR